MTLTQIKSLLDRTHEAVERISAELDAAQDIDASAAAIQDLGHRAGKIAGELRTLSERIRQHADAHVEAADKADSLADELDGVADQLNDFEDDDSA